jgi:acetyl-CoA C-acetyltransferase
MKEVVVTGAVRTAIGAFGGTLKSVSPTELARFIIQESVARGSVQADWIEKVIFGNCFAPLDVNISRIAAYQAGIPETVPAFSIDSTCGSAMQAIISATQSIQSEETGMLIAGGVESMSNAPYIMESARWGQRIRDAVAYDLLWRGMQEYPIGVGMGLTAENLAEKYSISRAEQDEFALLSQQRAAKAAQQGRFDAEIARFPVARRGKEPLMFATDEHVRPDITLEQLAKLPPAFKKDGTVTAGNACGMNDASAAVIVASRERAEELGLTPLVRIRSYYVAGVDPHIMGIGPVPAIRGALDRAGLKIEDIDLFEINEAFAAQYLACERELGLDRNKVNVNGGGIALGHPVGATGCRLIVTLVHRMMADGLEFGAASLCAGGGLGFCIIVQRV